MPGRSWNQGNEFDDQKFTGHFLEQEGNLGIYHAGARMYDPEVSRFYGTDAYYDKYPHLSTYHYAALNPISFIDVNGDSVVVAHYAVGASIPIVGDVEGPWHHAAIIHMDEESGDITVLAEAFKGGSKLEGRIGDWLNDRDEDFGFALTAVNTQTVPIPDGMTEAEFVEAINEAFGQYQNNVTYSPFPGDGTRMPSLSGVRPLTESAGAYNVANSNALVGSVLRAAGSDFKPSNVRLPGWNMDVPGITENR